MAVNLFHSERLMFGPRGVDGPQYSASGQPATIYGFWKAFRHHFPEEYRMVLESAGINPDTPPAELTELIMREAHTADDVSVSPTRVWLDHQGRVKFNLFPTPTDEITRTEMPDKELFSLLVSRAVNRVPVAPATQFGGSVHVIPSPPPRAIPEERKQVGYLIGVILNPKTLQPCLAYYDDSEEEILVTTPAGRKVGTGYFDSNKPAGTKYRLSEVSGYPRGHTPKGVLVKGEGYGTVLYAGLALAAHLNAEQDLDLDLINGDGISSNSHRSGEASEWWEAAKARRIAFDETFELDREQIEEYALEEELDTEEEFTTTLDPDRPSLNQELREALEYEDDIYASRIERVEVEGYQEVQVPEYTTEADILPFKRVRYRGLGVQNIVLAACNFAAYDLPSDKRKLKEAADFDEDSVLDFNDDVAKLLNLQGVGFAVLVTLSEMFRLAGKNKLFERLQEEALGTPMGYLLENPTRTADQRRVYEKLQIADYAALPD